MNTQFERSRGHDETIIVKVIDKVWSSSRSRTGLKQGLGLSFQHAVVV